ncbi:hypothetical protein BDQ17DRAFT_1367873, partial [Cyathus striatus]
TCGNCVETMRWIVAASVRMSRNKWLLEPVFCSFSVGITDGMGCMWISVISLVRKFV